MTRGLRCSWLIGGLILGLAIAQSSRQQKAMERTIHPVEIARIVDDPGFVAVSPFDAEQGGEHGAISAGLFERETLCHNLAELTFQDLSGRADRERFHDFEPFWQLERGDLLRPQVPDQNGERQLGSGLQDDARTGLFTKDRIWHGDQAHLPHLRKLKDEILDFITTDFLATAIDEILPASLGVDIAPALPDDVPHPVEAISGEGLGLRRSGPPT